MKDLIFDKVAMSSIYKLINDGILPKYENSMIELIYAYLRGFEDEKSYGWQRKFKLRYFRNIRS